MLAGLVFLILSLAATPIASAATRRIAGGTLPPYAAQGDQGAILEIGLAPVTMPLDLDSGGQATYEAEFTNSGTVAIHARAVTQDAIWRGEDGFEYADSGHEFWSAGNWVKVEPAEFDLDPGEAQTLTVSVDVPADVPDGEYYAAFFVQGTPTETFSAGGTSLAGRIGSVVYLAVGQGLGRLAELVPYGDIPRQAPANESFWSRLFGSLRHWWLTLVIHDRNVALVTEGQPLRVFLPLHNTGGSHIQPRATVTFESRGYEQATVVVDGDVIIPEEAALIEAVWPQAPLFGLVHARVRIDYGGAEPIEVERTFVIFPVKGVLGLVLLAFGLGYFVARRGRDRAPGRRPPAAPTPPGVSA